MKYDTFIGVDPGRNGAMVVLDAYDPGKPQTHLLKDPLTLYHAQFHDCVCGYGVAFIEKVHAMPGQGVTSMFNFGRNFGQMEMYLEHLALSGGWEYVTPTKWQRGMGIKKIAGETHTEKKNRHKVLAQELFPEIKVTHALADALLIAEYCRRVKRGDEKR